MRKLKATALTVFCAGTPIALWEGYKVLPGQPVSPPAIAYADAVTIVLTATTVVLAVLAVVVGGMALLGYHQIKEGATTAAKAAMLTAVQQEIQKLVNHPSIQAKIKEELDKSVSARWNEMLYANAFPQQPAEPGGGGTGGLAEEYPSGPQEGGPR